MVEIPLTSDPAQSFSIEIGGVLYTILVLYNTRNSTWSITLSSDIFEISGISILGGVDILAQYPDSPISNIFAVNTSGLTLDATLESLGDGTILVVATNEEVESVTSV